MALKIYTFISEIKLTIKINSHKKDHTHRPRNFSFLILRRLLKEKNLSIKMFTDTL